MRGFGNCVPPLPWRATGARTETRRRRGICLLRFMAGSRKGWTLPICSELDRCSNVSIEIGPACFRRADPPLRLGTHAIERFVGETPTRMTHLGFEDSDDP